MEKLIKLLNKYEKHKKTTAIRSYGEWLECEFQWTVIYFGAQSTLWIISKRYEFIKRLVEKDKIKIPELDLAPWKENTIIMMLSISSSPIDDLIWLLK